MNALSFTARRRPAVDTQAAARQLEALVRESAATGTARQALLLRLSALPRGLAQPHHLRLAHEALEPLGIADRARLFLLPNADAVMIWRGEAGALLATTRDRLRHLFADDNRALPMPERLAEHLDLPNDADALLAAIADSLAPPVARAANTKPRNPLDPATLAALERALAGAELSRFARRRAVCARQPGGGFQLVWEKRVFSLAELSETLAPDRDLKAAPWLFRRLTRTLDRRMMALLCAPDEMRDAGPFGLVLNVGSVLSPDFLRFDAALPSRLRGQVVLELHPADILADPAAFLFARDFARTRGYRLLLGGLTAELAGLFPLDGTSFDYFQLAWSPTLAAIDLAALGAIPGCLVLGGADSAAALQWGQANGVALYQGGRVQATRRQGAAIGEGFGASANPERSFPRRV